MANEIKLNLSRILINAAGMFEYKAVRVSFHKPRYVINIAELGYGSYVDVSTITQSTLRYVLLTHSKYTEDAIEYIIKNSGLNNYVRFLMADEDGYIIAITKDYIKSQKSVRDVAKSISCTELNRCAKKARKVLNSILHSDDSIEGVRTPPTDKEFNDLRDELFYDHNLFVAVRGRKFAPIEVGTIFELSKHSDEQIIELCNAYGAELDLDAFLPNLAGHRNRSFGITFLNNSSCKSLYYVTDLDKFTFAYKNSAKVNVNIKHYDDVCMEE